MDNAGEVLTGLTFTSGNAAVTAENFQYGYNTAQNMVARTNSATVNSYTVNNLNQTTTDGTGYTLAYDNNGNRTGKLWSGSIFYTYDDENQLIAAATDTTAWPVANRWKTEWTYDARGRMRTRKEYTHNGTTWVLGSETRHLYDGRRVIQERNSSNVPLVTYVRGLDLSGTFEGAGGIGGMLGRTAHSGANGATLTHAFYHADANGNITKMVNTSQASVADYKYDPFGRTISSSGTLAAANTYQFSSKELMAKSGFYYYGFRFYDPQTQRWPNRDPRGEKGGVNLYAFAANNPCGRVDPLGLDPFDKFKTCDDAARDFKKYIGRNKLVVDGQHMEQGSAIFKDGDGKYYYNTPQHGKRATAGSCDIDYNFKMNDKDKLAGDAHDHIKGDDFSPQDRKKNDDLKLPGYVVTPPGDLIKYDPSTRKTTPVKGD